MDNRYHFFLTVLMASVIIGYGIHDFSTGDMSDFSRITDIDIAEEKVTLRTDCFSIEVAGSEALIDNLEKVVYQGDMPYSLELFEMNLRKDSEFERVEISRTVSGKPIFVLFLENGDSMEIESITGLMLAAENEIPVYVENKFIRTEGKPICLGQSLEI